MLSGRELFARQGPLAQMDEIAAHAGVGIGTVYRHFPTKEALLTAMVRERFQEFAEIASRAEDIDDPLQALQVTMRESAEAVEGDVGFQLAMMGSDELEWEGIDEQKAALAEVVTRIIHRAVAAGVVRDDFTFDDFGMVMCGITSTMYYKPGSANWRHHLELILHGVCRASVPGGLAAIDVQDLPGDERGALEVEDSVDDIAHLSKPPERMQGRHSRV